ncbi:MAG: hypothetical protein MZV63_12520 [Marinilabiliales bacterium]|nr:hypothetical protein [Marinilabiliales bacterium]
MVSDPLMILATAPRVLSPGDRVALPVTVFAQKKEISDVNVTATGNEMVSFTQAAGSVRFTEPGDKDLELLFNTAQQPGKAVINVRAEGGGESASYDMEVQVRTPNPPERRAETRSLSPGEKYEKSFTPFGIAGTSSASVEIFSLPSVNLSRRLSWLTSFPHGCTEQITSAAFPQIYLPDLLGSSLPDPATGAQQRAGGAAQHRFASDILRSSYSVAGQLISRRLGDIVCRPLRHRGTEGRLYTSGRVHEQVDSLPACHRLRHGDTSRSTATLPMTRPTGSSPWLSPALPTRAP